MSRHEGSTDPVSTSHTVWTGRYRRPPRRQNNRCRRCSHLHCTSPRHTIRNRSTHRSRRRSYPHCTLCIQCHHRSCECQPNMTHKLSPHSCPSPPVLRHKSRTRCHCQLRSNLHCTKYNQSTHHCPDPPYQQHNRCTIQRSMQNTDPQHTTHMQWRDPSRHQPSRSDTQRTVLCQVS